MYSNKMTESTEIDTRCSGLSLTQNFICLYLFECICHAESKCNNEKKFFTFIFLKKFENIDRHLSFTYTRMVK